MGYWDNQEEYAKRGMDYDFCAAVEYNNIDVDFDNVRKVLALFEGENDGDSWRWIFVTNDNRYAFMKGWCDYTGWDCQSGCNVTYFDNIKDTVRFMITEESTGGWQNEKRKDVINSLITQLIGNKHTTWSETFDINKPEDF